MIIYLVFVFHCDILSIAVSTINTYWLHFTVLELCCVANPDISYVTFSKASEAALAIEEMSGKCLRDNPRPLKVVLSVISVKYIAISEGNSQCYLCQVYRYKWR